MITRAYDLDTACRLACDKLGVVYQAVDTDGRFHCADLANDHKGKNDARIKLFPDRQGGIVWNHKSGEQQTFFIDRQEGETLTTAERERIANEQKQRQADVLQRQTQAAQRAKAIWQNATPAPTSHPYLTRKHIQAHGLRAGNWQRFIKNDHGKPEKWVIENVLLVPMVDATGKLCSLQAIFANACPMLGRDKDFLAGGGVAGLFWWLGAKTNKVLIAEGFATAASLHEATDYRVYLAFTANNLLAVGRILREKLPDAELVFCGDNDLNTLGNPGLTKAREAAQAVGGLLAVPPVAGDFNDWAVMLRRNNNEPAA